MYNLTSTAFNREKRRALLGCVFIFFLACPALADTITLKNGTERKGLVVEEHTDRIILSTEKGEIPILRRGITNIVYDEPAQNFLKIGQEYEADNRLGEALAYYEKAQSLNPGLAEAASAATRVRNRFWASLTEGPRDEMERKQELYDAWERGTAVNAFERKKIEERKRLRDGLGLALGKSGEWLELESVDSKKPAAVAGLKKGDRLTAIDGRSLRYLNETAVLAQLLEPRFTNFTLEIERDVFLPGHVSFKALGMKLKLEYQGLIVRSVKKYSQAEKAGARSRDLIVRVNGEATRYMPLGQVERALAAALGADERASLTIRRGALLARV